MKLFKDKFINVIEDATEEIQNDIADRAQALTDIIKSKHTILTAQIERLDNHTKDYQDTQRITIDEIRQIQKLVEDLQDAISDQRLNDESFQSLEKKIEILEQQRDTLLRECDSLENKIQDMQEQLDKKDAYLNKLLEINKEKDKSIWEIAGALSAVTEGVFREDCVEFACLKTYRGGWQYIYINGEQAKDFRMAQNLCLYWAEGEPVNLEVNVESRKN